MRVFYFDQEQGMELGLMEGLITKLAAAKLDLLKAAPAYNGIGVLTTTALDAPGYAQAAALDLSAGHTAGGNAYITCDQSPLQFDWQCNVARTIYGYVLKTTGGVNVLAVQFDRPIQQPTNSGFSNAYLTLQPMLVAYANSPNRIVDQSVYGYSLLTPP